MIRIILAALLAAVIGGEIIKAHAHVAASGPIMVGEAR